MTQTHQHKHTGRARTLRRNATDAEQRLWRHLRSRQLGGFKFRRQKPIGSLIVDFVCQEAGLIVEIDGGRHGDMQQQDQSRTIVLENEGYRVIRFWNNEVLAQTQAVLTEILRQLESIAPHPDPLPASEARGKEI